MTTVSASGAWPGGEDLLEAQLAVFGLSAELPSGVDGCPPLVWLPDRGPGADRLGRTAALLVDLPTEIGPHGWKLADRPGSDVRRAVRYLHDDLAALAIAGAGYTGPLTVSVLGPWTLAARLYLARGDVVLADAGAVHELAHSLALGIAEHVADVLRQVPGARLVVQIDESGLRRVLAGQVATFSGYSRIRPVPGPEAVEGLRPVLDAVHAAGALGVVHTAIPGVAVAALSGADGVGLRVGGWDEPLWTVIARAVVRGMSLWARIGRPAQGRQPAALADAVRVGWGRIGLPAARLGEVRLLDDDVAPTPARARESWRELGRAAEVLAEWGQR